MSKEHLKVSDEAVASATGRTWEDWQDYLDERGAASSTHKEIVTLVAEEVKSPWWQQMIANAYEKLTGRRSTGETQKGTFQIGVQRTLDAPPEAVWKVVASPTGQAAWLGPGAALSLVKGETYSLDDGTVGEVRIGMAAGHVRLTRMPPTGSQHATMQVRVTPKGGDRSILSFHEEHLPSSDVRETRRSHFKDAVSAVERMLEDDRDAA